MASLIESAEPGGRIADAAALHRRLGGDGLSLEPLRAEHREGLRDACAGDADIWSIMPVSYGPGQFARSFDDLLASPTRLPFAILTNALVIGMSGYIAPDRPNRVVEIGGTYMAPQSRGTGLNARVKRLLIDHAKATGFERIELRIDTRNARSMAAVEKLGAVHEGIMQRQRITWTGYRRDTTLYAILADAWQATAS